MATPEDQVPSNPVDRAYDFVDQAFPVLIEVAGSIANFDPRAVVAMFYGGYEGIDVRHLIEEDAGPEREASEAEPRPSSEALARLSGVRQLLYERLRQEFGEQVAVEEPVGFSPVVEQEGKNG